jgi:hypothetical protein
MMFCMYCILRAISFHYKQRSGQSRKGSKYPSRQQVHNKSKIMEMIASPSTPASANQQAPAVDGSMVPLVSAEDFYLKHDRLMRAVVVLCHGLTHDDGTPAISLLAPPWSTMKKSAIHILSKEYQAERLPLCQPVPLTQGRQWLRH